MLGIVTVLTWMVTVWSGHLPILYTGGVTQQTLAANLVNVFMWFMGVMALGILLVRRRSILDLWLIVVLVAWMPNFIVAAIVPVVRFSVGWYLARGYALIASCTVLMLLLAQTTVLYARLATTFTLLRREHVNRLMSVDVATAAIAHEVTQPLTAIVVNGESALILLNQARPNLEEVRTCVEEMVEASQRSGKVISSIRKLVKKTTGERTRIHIDGVIRQVLKLSEHDLRVQSVAVTTQYQDNLPRVQGDRTLLQQALLNLVRNAIEAMSLVEPPARRLRVTTRLNGNSVVISVEDAGCGVPAEYRDRLFDPFFTSKSTGTGLGLSVCRTIVEDHGGELRLVKTDSHGSIFEIVLPLRLRSRGKV
jgi:signal transduction histidine kinase